MASTHVCVGMHPTVPLKPVYMPPKRITEMIVGSSSVVEYLPNMHKTLGLILNIKKKKEIADSDGACH